MIHASVMFGTRCGRQTDELEEAAEGYLSSMYKPGQLCGEHFIFWFKGRLSAHVLLAGRNAMERRYHSDWGKRELNKVIESFGREPVWRIMDDKAERPTPSWKGTPFLYLFTHAFDWISPVCRGDGKPPVPAFTLPVSFELKEQLYFWQRAYRQHDSIWLGSGALEIAAYRQLADPTSDLAEDGRDICRQIEAGTAVPTFYYLMRYWARPKGEDQRRCPGCGRNWAMGIERESPGHFWQFDFKCNRCRLVSHLGVSTDGGRHTRIGEFARKA